MLRKSNTLAFDLRFTCNSWRYLQQISGMGFTQNATSVWAEFDGTQA